MTAVGKAEHERVWCYVERFFAARGRTEWPTVRRIARAFRWTQQRVSDAVDGDPDCRLFLSSYQGEYPLGEHFVESTGDARR